MNRGNKEHTAIQASVWTKRQGLIIQSKIMRLSREEAVAWVNGRLPKGEEITLSTYEADWTEIHQIKDIKIMELASRGMFEQHMDRINNLELVLELSWRNYHKLSVKDPYKSQKVLDSIAALQPLLSQYYEATKHIVEEEAPQVIALLESQGIKTPEEIIKIFQAKDIENRNFQLAIKH